MRFKKSPQLPGAGRTRAWHHHGSHTLTSPGAILLSKMACQPKHIGRQCISSCQESFIYYIEISNGLLYYTFLPLHSALQICMSSPDGVGANDVDSHARGLQLEPRLHQHLLHQ